MTFDRFKDTIKVGGIPPLKDCIELGKGLIGNWQWAHVFFDDVLADKYGHQKKELDLWVMNNLSEEDACKYFTALYE